MDPKKKLAVVGLLLFIPIYVYFFGSSGPTGSGGGFPEIPPGSYRGTITWQASDGRNADIEPWYLESKDGQVQFVFTAGPGALLGPIPLDGSSITTQQPNGETIRISGDSVRYGNYAGTILGESRRGEWTAKVVSSASGGKPPDSGFFKRIVSLRQEDTAVRQRLDSLRKKNAQLEEEVRRLSNLVLDSRQLKKDAEKKFRDLRQEVEEITVQRDTILREVKALQKKVALAQRVTAAGQLVSLSRKSIDREMRWFESMFKGSDILSGSNVGSEYDRALLKVDLRAQIIKHRETVQRLKELSNRRSLYDLPY